MIFLSTNKIVPMVTNNSQETAPPLSVENIMITLSVTWKQEPWKLLHKTRNFL